MVNRYKSMGDFSDKEGYNSKGDNSGQEIIGILIFHLRKVNRYSSLRDLSGREVMTFRVFLLRYLR